ncbi:hypothetical protein, partial [Sphingobacterium gobiense]
CTARTEKIVSYLTTFPHQGYSLRYMIIYLKELLHLRFALRLSEPYLNKARNLYLVFSSVSEGTAKVGKFFRKEKKYFFYSRPFLLPGP